MARNARFIPFFLFLMVSGLSYGQTAPVVVTATRTAQTVDASLAPVSVIDREEIEARNYDEEVMPFVTLVKKWFTVNIKDLTWV